MKKTRMSIDDIHAMVGSIRKNVLNMRVTNIYDLQSTSGDKSKTYIFKLHQPPYPKVFLLLESGIRFHTSKYARDASSSSATLPSQFTMKLRKHLRGKRLVALQQLEGDRVVDLTFGSDQLQCHLILELYASGNIILTDENYNILSLLRTHKFDENVKMAVKQVYPIEVLENKPPSDSIQTVPQLTAFVTKWFADLDVKAATMGGGASKAKKKVQTLKQLLLMKESSFGGLGPVIVEHCVVSADLQPGLKIKNAAEFEAIGEDRLAKLVEELQCGWKLLEKLQAEQNTAVVDTAEDGTPLDVPASATPKEKCGFIIMKERADESLPEQYEEFTPYLYAQHRAGNKKVQSFDTFDEAVDEYFSRFEAETAEVAKQAAQLAAEAKLAKLKKNQKTQIDQLLEVQDKSLKHARLIEENQQDVENVLLVIRSALASGMDWRGLEELVRFEQKNGNPVASLIHELDLAHNRVSILLCDNDNDEDDEDEDDDEKDQQDKQAHVIWIDLSLSALANAREIYTKKKKAGEKVQKATEATQRAISAAEKSTTKTLQKQQMKRNTIYERRKIMWFEKFHWFLTNEKYLVIAGKDAHQNELLVKRYLRKGDVYVHADLHGAATCVVRNRAAVAGEKTIPPIPVGTLEQAGCMSVCRSNAWTSQVIAGAYWVHADQVSKTAPAGEYLTTGSFMIRGKKNYIQPSRLEMGLAIVFRVDESSVANHKGEDGGDKVPPAREYDADADVDEDATQQEETAVELEESQDTVTTQDDGDDKADVDEASTNAVEESVPPQVAEEDNEAEEARDEDETTNDSVAVAERSGKKRLSAKERRDLKKGKLPGALSQAPADASNNKAAPKEKTPAASSKTNDTAKNVRGKKGKLKKLKKKYADQDDEDRRLRMELLGHALPDEEAADEGQEGSGDASDDDEDLSKNDNDGEKKPKTKDGADEDEIRKLREKKEKFLEEQEEEAEGADFFDTFTGSPFPNDLVLYAMPMCAPYASLQKYKYKVKLLPGAQKKGKAAKQAMEYFFSSNMKFEKDAAKQQIAHKAQASAGNTATADEATPDVDPLVVQRELMRCIPENELVNCMVGPVKISAPGIYGSSAGGKKGGGGSAKKKPSKGKK
ncbi:Nuclear export mediator factor, partial [Globisporangium splendens]